MLDDQIIECCRTADRIARQKSATEISIADFVLGLCQDGQVGARLARMGCDVRGLRERLEVSRTSGASLSRTTRLPLSAKLNALLVAAEHGAVYAGHARVSLDVLFATLIQNANQDEAAHLFKTHVQAQQQARAHAVEQTNQHMVRVAEHGSVSTGHMQNDARQRHIGSASSHAAHFATAGNASYEESGQMKARPLHTARTQRNARSRDGHQVREYDRTRTGVHDYEREHATRDQEHYQELLRLLRVQEDRLERLEQRDTKQGIQQSWSNGNGSGYSSVGAHKSKSQHEHTTRSESLHRTEYSVREGHSHREHDTRSERLSHQGVHDSTKTEKRFYLSLDDDLVEAPSIGPKTAARFEPLGIRTVRDLLSLDVTEAADKLNVRHITADVLSDWQDQARLVCTVPWLRGTHAQLLVGAEYRSAKEIATADLGEVLAGILRFAATSQGERVLRTNPPPERDKVNTWIGFAKQADITRAA